MRHVYCTWHEACLPSGRTLAARTNTYKGLPPAAASPSPARPQHSNGNVETSTAQKRYAAVQLAISARQSGIVTATCNAKGTDLAPIAIGRRSVHLFATVPGTNKPGRSGPSRPRSLHRSLSCVFRVFFCGANSDAITACHTHYTGSVPNRKEFISRVHVE